jgi:PAS domain S-box-containing protein
MSVNKRLASDEGATNTPTATSVQNITEHQLRERIKELSCLYDIAAILSDRTQSQAQLAQAFVARLVAAWQFAEVTCVRLHLFDQIYTTSNFAETPWQLSSDVLVNEIYAGRLTVGYLVACPEADEGPFLQEERSLIDQCAWQLSRTIEGRQTQEAMVRRGDLLHSIVNATPDIIITVDRQARITYINRVLAGLTIEHVIGAPAIDYVDQPHRQLVRAAIDYVFATAQPTSYEIQARGLNDNIAWYASRLAPLMQNGQVAQVLLIAEDITERKQAEQALAASERHFSHPLREHDAGCRLSRGERAHLPGQPRRPSRFLACRSTSCRGAPPSIRAGARYARMAATSPVKSTPRWWRCARARA